VPPHARRRLRLAALVAAPLALVLGLSLATTQGATGSGVAPIAGRGDPAGQGVEAVAARALVSRVSTVGEQPAGTDPSPAPAGASHYVIQAGGLPRKYSLHLPVGRGAPAAGRPLLIVLDGKANVYPHAENTYGVTELGQSRNAAVVYGVTYQASGTWDAGNCCNPAAAQHVDDVAYVRGVIADVETRTTVDPRHVYLLGFSLGGMLAYRVACQTDRLVAGIAVMSGSVQVSGCHPSHSVRVLAVHGLRDTIVPFLGQTRPAKLPAPSRSVAASLAPFLSEDGCTRSGHAYPSTVDTARAFAQIVTVRYRCARGSVTLVVDSVLGHRWPRGVAGYDPELDATRLIAEAFLPRRG